MCINRKMKVKYIILALLITYKDGICRRERKPSSRPKFSGTIEIKYPPSHQIYTSRDLQNSWERKCSSTEIKARITSIYSAGKASMNKSKRPICRRESTTRACQTSPLWAHSRCRAHSIRWRARQISYVDPIAGSIRGSQKLSQQISMRTHSMVIKLHSLWCHRQGAVTISSVWWKRRRM